MSRVDGPGIQRPCAPAEFGDCLPAEVVPFDGEDTQIFFGGVRLDKYLSNGAPDDLEGGHAQGGFGVFQAVGQRAKSVDNDGKRPWARFSSKGDQFNVAPPTTATTSRGYIGLTTGSPFNSDSYRLQAEGQTNRSFRQDSDSARGGRTAGIEKMNSYNPEVGRQTFLFRPVTSDTQALFGQGALERQRASESRAGGAVATGARSTTSSSRRRGRSPTPSTPNHSVRLTYSRAFQVPNSLEYFLNAPVAPPADLSALQRVSARPFGVDCGFGSTPVLAVGNEDLGVERVRTWEVGYKGVSHGRALLTVDYYRSRSSNLATSLLPQLGTPLGRLNPHLGRGRARRGCRSGRRSDPDLRATALESLRRLEHPGGGVVHQLRPGRHSRP